jgi:hypothetical protein
MAMEDPTILVSQALTQTGGNCSHMKQNTSSMLRTRNALMSRVAKTQKVKPSGFGEDTMDLIKDGRLFILMIKKMIEQRE